MKEYPKQSLIGLVASSTVLFFVLFSIITLPLTYVLSKSIEEYGTIMAPESLDIFYDSEIMRPSQIVAYDDAGKEHVLGIFYDQNRVIVGKENIPQTILDATVASEDTNFYNHNGIDFKGVIRAGVANYTNEKIVQGGSSITQQYVKNVIIQNAEWLAGDERSEAYRKAVEESLNRKFNEIKYAIALEKTMSKDEILTNYLNIVGFGGQIYGITAAAEYYYGKELKQLTLDESATLVAIINAPEIYRIDKPESSTNGESNNYALTLERRNYILTQMLNMGHIAQTQYDYFYGKKIVPNINKTLSGCGITGWGDYFCEHVLSDIKESSFFGETVEERLQNFRRGGYKVTTTLNVDLQQETQTIVNNYVPTYSERMNIGASVVTVESNTGNILVMQQNTKYSPSENEEPGYTSINYSSDKNHGGSLGFPTGSTFKLFTLIEWLQQGKRLSTAVTGENNYTSIPHSCVSLKEGQKFDDTYWRGNYTIYNSGQNEEDLIERNPETGEPLLNPETGEIIKKPLLVSSVLSATAASYNTIYMSMAKQLDLCDIYNNAVKMGHTRADGDEFMTDPAMVLGVNETAPLNVASSYAVVSNDGVKCTARSFTEIRDGSTNKLVAQNSPRCVEVLESNITDATSYALTRAANGTGYVSKPNDGIAVGIKTGTSDDAYHTWVAGYTSETATAVWVGNVEGFTSLQRIAFNGINGAQLRHRIFKNVQTEVNNVYGGAETFNSPERKFL